MFSTIIGLLFQPLNFGLMILGCIIGIIFGAIPGLSNVSAIALMLPLTFAMSSETGIIYLGAIFVGGVSGGMISSILLGVPGSNCNIATCLDGFPMTQKGKATRALGIAIISSFISTLISLVIAMLFCPIIARLALLLGPWEFFSLCATAIVLVITMSKGNVYAGLTAGALGMLLSTVGIAPVDGAKRFTFGITSLLGGIPTLAVTLGIFAVANLALNYARGKMDSPSVDVKGLKGFGISLSEYFSHWKLILRSFMIGLWVGFLPGMGAGLSNVVAYADAKSNSKHPELFGTGIDEGIIAPEIANNASVGGAVIPTIALGIPGDNACALLLSGLMIKGIDAGPLLMTNSPKLVYCFFGCMILSTVVVFALEFLGMRIFPRVLQVPTHYMYAAIFIICFIGVYSNTYSIFSLWLMIILAALGFLMHYGELPLSPFILGFILGPMMEDYLRKGLTYSDKGFLLFLQRPISAILIFIAVASLAWPPIRELLAKRRAATGKESELDRISKDTDKMEVEE